MKNLTKLIILLVVFAVLLGTLWGIQKANKQRQSSASRQQSAPFFPGLAADRIFRVEVDTIGSQQKQSLLFRKEAGVWEVARGRDVLGDLMRQSEKNAEAQGQQSTQTQESVQSTEAIKPADETVQPPASQETIPPPANPAQDMGPTGDPYRAFFKADSDKVQAMVDAIVNLKHGQLVTSDPTKKSQFGVLNTIVGTEIVMFDDQMNKVADIVIGNPGGGFQSVFVRLPDSDDIYEVASNLKMIFETSLLAIRDKTVFEAAPETIMSVNIKNIEAKTDISLSRVEGIWKGTNAEGGSLELAADKVDSLLSSLGSLSANSFVDESMRQRPPQPELNEQDPYGLLSPTTEVSFTTSDNVTHTLTVGRLEGTVYYVIADGNMSDVFKLSNTVVNGIRPSAEQLKGAPNAAQISGVQPETGNLVRGPGNVMPVQPGGSGG